MKVKLPNNWKWAKCSEVIDVRDGTHNTPKYVSCGYPLITSKNLKPGGIDFSEIYDISEKDHNEISKRSKVDKGDILFAMIGTIGNPVIVDTNQEFSIKNIALFKLNNEIINTKYFKHLLESPILTRQLNSETRGGTQKFVSLKVLRNMIIPLPPLEEQKRIAAILDKADAIRRKRKKAIALTEELLRSTFLDMFGDPVTNPKGWDVTKLQTTFVQSPQIGTIEPAHTNGSCHVIRVGEIGGQEVELDKCGKINLIGKELDKFRCKPGDFLLARAIGSESHLGKASILQQTDRDVVFDSHVMRLRFDSSKLIPNFFLQWLKSKGGRYLFMRRAGRTAVQFNVNGKQMSNIDIALPPIDFQREFLEFQNKIMRSNEKNGKGRELTTNLFNALLQQAFCGEL